MTSPVRKAFAAIERNAIALLSNFEKPLDRRMPAGSSIFAIGEGVRSRVFGTERGDGVIVVDPPN